MLKRTIYYIIASSVFFLLYPKVSFGQYNNTIFWMSGIPQSSYANPALIPDADFFIGIPGISSHFSGVSNSGFAFQDVLRKNTMGDFYWDEDNMLQSLRNKNLLDGHVMHELLGFGWKSRSNYFSFSASEKFAGSFSYPADFMTLIVKGNDHFLQQQTVADLSGVAVDAMHYREFALGYARDMEQVFSFGVRAKALFGMSNIWFDKTDFSLITLPDSYILRVNANMLVNTSFPFAVGPIDSLDLDKKYEFSRRDYLSNARNMGFAADLGVTWKPVPEITIAASVLDLGFIDWRQGVENFRMNGEFEFRGVDLNDFFNNDNNTVSFENLLDSIKTIFDVEETARSYRTPLTSRVFLAAAWDMAPKHKLGTLLRGELYRGHLWPSYTLSYNYKPVKAFALTLAYSVIHNSFHNLGAGMHANLGPVQLYVAGDNFLGMMQPHTMKATNIHLGMNLVFGYRSRDIEAPLFSW